MVYLGKTISNILHIGASDTTIRLANRFRRKPTRAESILWNELKGRKLGGIKFRRQHPILYYVADFYCHEHRIVIEVDGKIHRISKQKEHDENRTAVLEQYGIKVIRFSNEEIIHQLDNVKITILDFIEKNPFP